jgi:hypothetical protein
MFLYFEDYSSWLSILDKKGILHGGNIIKVYALQEDPRILLGNPRLAVIESNDHPFANELFSYNGRESYTGKQIEELIGGLHINDIGTTVVRALFRFSNRDDLQFCQVGMGIKNHDGGWLINTPLQDIDGLEQASRQPGSRSLSIHLDVFVPESLQRLDALIGFHDPEHLVGMRDGLKLKGLDKGRRGTEKE